MSTPGGRVFSSWKEIATFLGKGVRTVQRWEKTLGLPVRRPNGAASNVVVATESDLRRWMGEGAPRPAAQTSEMIDTRKIHEKLELLEATNKRFEMALLRLESRFTQIERAMISDRRTDMIEGNMHRRRHSDNMESMVHPRSDKERENPSTR